jgi:hypothetical protein
MSIHPQAIAPVPEETAQVAKLVFPKGNNFILIITKSNCAPPQTCPQQENATTLPMTLMRAMVTSVQ